MRPTEPLPLHHSWPLVERDQRFDWGMLHDAPPALFLTPDARPESADAGHGIGRWECDLADDGLTWTGAVYDIFGLPRHVSVVRAQAVALYATESRAAMERLRRHAIRYRRGFTLDAEIATPAGARRWLRLIAAPVCAAGKAVRLHGLKQDVTHLYR